MHPLVHDLVQDAVPPLGGAIDVHAHYLTDRLRTAMTDAGHAMPDGMPAIPEWSPRAALELMDQAGIRAALLSVSSPGVHFGDDRAAAALARSVNDEGLALVERHPDRFGLMASLPLPDVPAAIAEAERALDAGADGITLKTHYDGSYLGDARFDPLMQLLDERSAVVCLHPTSSPCWEATSLGHPRPMLEFPFETTRAVANLALSRTLERCPRISFIVPHAGAALPVLADRIAAFALMAQPGPAVDVLAVLRRLYYDTAGFSLPRALPALLHLVDGDRLLYGSDYPFTPGWVVQALAQGLAEDGGLTPPQQAAMLHGNASRLFPRFAVQSAV
ncbi:amidohydrolase family protein [Streptacidiphilus sp. N1-3]|uniref:6-methylsalicylate decarboxylase n=1 Tax=Streptacidiphilus alkalitolerans TaxID=3342712 RepID=A0ABV6X0G3_9ACTN